MTVGELRKALEGVPDDTEVAYRAVDDYGVHWVFAASANEEEMVYANEFRCDLQKPGYPTACGEPMKVLVIDPES